MALEEIRPGRHIHVVKRDNAAASPNSATIFFVHGSMAHHGQFEQQLQAFASHKSVKTVVAYDGWGCGKSDKPETAWTEYAEDELLHDLHSLFRQYADPAGRNIVIGHSFGTNLSLRLANDLNELAGRQPLSQATNSAAASEQLMPKVAGLVLIGTSHEKPGSSWLFYLPVFILDRLRVPLGKAFLSRAFHPDTPQHVLDAATAHNRSNPWHVIRPFYQQVHWGATKVLQSKSISIPTAVIVGEADCLTDVAASEAVSKAIPGSTFHVIKSASHMVMMEQPVQVNDIIEQLLLRVLGPPQMDSKAAALAAAATDAELK